MTQSIRLPRGSGPTVVFALVLATAVAVDGFAPRNDYREIMYQLDRRAGPENGELERWIRTYEELESRRENARTHWERIGIDAAIKGHESRLADLLTADVSRPDPDGLEGKAIPARNQAVHGHAGVGMG